MPFVGDANAFAARALTTAGHGAFLHPTNFDKDKSQRESNVFREKQRVVYLFLRKTCKTKNNHGYDEYGLFDLTGFL